jgi:hypothetical protein
MAVNMESVNPPLPLLSPNHSEIEGIEPVVNPCAEAWTNDSRYWAAVENADSDEESDGDEGRMPSSESEDGEDDSLSDSDSSDGGHGIEDTIKSENWAILVCILTCLSPHNFSNNVSTVEELADEELAYLRQPMSSLQAEKEPINHTQIPWTMRMMKAFSH